ncbi:hypothetical protein GCM10009602_07870 [Nocardiopsis tropica]
MHEEGGPHRVAHQQPGLLPQLTAQSLVHELAVLDPTPGQRPAHLAAGAEALPHEQDLIALADDADEQLHPRSGGLRILCCHAADRARGPFAGCRGRPGPASPRRLPFMLDASDGQDRIFRRDGRIRLPLARPGRHAKGIAYLAPEVQRLYRAKRPRPKDEQDFSMALPKSRAARRRRLSESIALVHGDHPWLARLRES